MFGVDFENVQWEAKVEAAPNLEEKQDVLHDMGDAMQKLADDGDFLNKLYDYDLAFDFSAYNLKTGDLQKAKNGLINVEGLWAVQAQKSHYLL